MKLYLQQFGFVLVRFAALLAICAAFGAAVAFAAFIVSA